MMYQNISQHRVHKEGVAAVTPYLVCSLFHSFSTLASHIIRLTCQIIFGDPLQLADSLFFLMAL